MSTRCLLCQANNTPGGHTHICDECYDNAGNYVDTNIHLILALPYLLDACETALRDLHCPDGDDAECGAIALLKDAIAMTKKA
jgi:hypothetical protein